MTKWIMGFVCLTACLHAHKKNAIGGAEPKQPKVSYDTDLFRDNKKVLFVNAEFLYWTVNESALDYALVMKSPAWGNPTQGVGHYKVIDFGWNPGFRVNFGYFNAPHYWDTFVEYTYFRCTGKDKTHAPSASHRYLNGTWSHPAFDHSEHVPLERARSSIDLSLDLLEGLFTRRFHPNPHLRMKLYGGLSVAWLRQNWEIDYRDTAQYISHLHSHWRFTGAGVRAGYMVDWFLGKGGFYFTGLVSAAIYAGHYHNVSKQHSTDSNAGQFNTELPFRNVHYRDTRLVPHFQVMAGPSWQMAFTNYRTELFIGYELNFWTNIHEVYRTTTSAPTQAKETIMSNAVVGIQGLTVRWNLDF